MLSAVRSRGIRMKETTRTGASAIRMMGRTTFEEMAVNADAEQLKLMEEQIVQVDEQDEIVGPISKKDGTAGTVLFAFLCTVPIRDFFINVI